VLRQAVSQRDLGLADLGDPHGVGDDDRRHSAGRAAVRDGRPAGPQRALCSVHRPGAAAARVGGLRLEVRLPSPVRPGRLSPEARPRPSCRSPVRSAHRHGQRRHRRRMAVGAALFRHHREAARDLAAAASRGGAARLRADLGGPLLHSDTDAVGAAGQSGLREDGRVAARFRPDLRHDARRAGRGHRNARHVRLLPGVHRVRPDLLCLEHGGPDDDRDLDPVHGDLEMGPLTARSLPRLAGRAVIGVVALLVLVPVVWTLMSSFKHTVDIETTPPLLFFKPTLDNFLYVLERSSVRGALVNSIIVSTSSVLIGAALGLPCAYAVARYPTRHADDIQFFVLSLRFLPPIAVALPLMVIWLDLGLYDTRIAMIVTYTLFTLSITIWLAIPAFRQVPKEIEEAAFIDGYSAYAIFFRIALPVASKSLIGAI